MIEVYQRTTSKRGLCRYLFISDTHFIFTYELKDVELKHRIGSMDELVKKEVEECFEKILHVNGDMTELIKIFPEYFI